MAQLFGLVAGASGLLGCGLVGAGQALNGACGYGWNNGGGLFDGRCMVNAVEGITRACDAILQPLIFPNFSSGGFGVISSGGSSGGTSGSAEYRKIEFPKDDSQLGHTFRDRKGHFEHDTPRNRELIEDAANNGNTYGPDDIGNMWADKVTEDGSQVWVKYRGNKIQEAGINAPGEHRTYNQKTGFDHPK